jgi:hypothetical protein
VLPQNSQGKISGAYIVNYQSFYMLFKCLFVKESILNPNPFFDSIYFFNFCLTLVKLLIIYLCCSVLYKRVSLFSFSFLLLGGMLMMPYGSTYGNVLLIFLFVSCLSEFDHKKNFIIACLVLTVSNISISYFDSLPIPFQFPRLFLLTILFICVYILSSVRLNWKLLFCFPLAFLSATFTNVKTQSNENLLINTDEHILIFDYGVNDNILFYKYWEGKGGNSFQTTIRCNLTDTKEAKLINNQIFFKNKQLTFSTDHKLKPEQIDNKIVYLSDKERGMGFYALWYVPIK